jgi:uncharacterized glyoxalase superfamily protein PhnB
MGMTDSGEQAALRDQCTVFLTGHGPVRTADLLASIPADTVPDRYGNGGVVAELEAEVAGLLGKPAAVYLPSGTMAQQSVLRVPTIMHGQLVTDAGYTIMAADVPSHMEYHAPAGFSVSLSGDDGDALRGYFEQLAAGGTVTMPLQKQVWGDEFGMCVDQFGISWLANISQPRA